VTDAPAWSSAWTDSGVRRYVQYESTQAFTVSASGVRPFPSSAFTALPHSISNFTVEGTPFQAATCSAVLFGDVEVSVSLVQCRDGHAEIEEVPNTVRVPCSCELGQQLATIRQNLGNQGRFGSRDGMDSRGIISRTRGNQLVNAVKFG
jgi:hypothetical protein